MSQLLLLNPRKRRSRKAKKSASPRRRRSAAQRAATARMLAANRGRRSRRAVVHANPVRRSRRRSYRRNPVGRARRYLSANRAHGVTGMLMAGAIGGVGAVGVDVLFGQVNRFLPASMAAPVDANGQTNWLYFAAKAAVAVGVGVFGRKVIPARYAEAAANGALTIMAYQIARSLVPASVTMGAYMNPGRVMRPAVGMNGVGAYLPASGVMPQRVVQPMRSTASAFAR